MRLRAVVLLAAGFAISIGTFMLPWFETPSGGDQLVISPLWTRICSSGSCFGTIRTEGIQLDSRWLGMLGACRIAGGLGIVAAACAAAMTRTDKTQLGTGRITLKRGHLLVVAWLGLGLVASTAMFKPAGASIASGLLVTLVGYAVEVGGLHRLRQL